MNDLSEIKPLKTVNGYTEWAEWNKAATLVVQAQALPCPFCGRKPSFTGRACAVSESSPTGEIFFLACHGGRCSAHAHIHGYTLEEVIANWNTRFLAQQSAHESFQSRVRPWLLTCFGEAIASDKSERNHRFLEESLELVQALGCTQDEAHQLVDYVFGRPSGDPLQEVGGVTVTLAALCLANALDMAAAGEVELARIWTKVEQIRAKQAAKPRHSPLPR